MKGEERVRKCDTTHSLILVHTHTQTHTHTHTSAHTSAHIFLSSQFKQVNTGIKRMAMVRLLLQGKLEAGESRGKKMLEVMVHLGACALQSCSAPTHTCTVTHTRQSIRSGVLPPSSLVIFSYPFVSPFPLSLPSPPSPSTGV